MSQEALFNNERSDRAQARTTELPMQFENCQSLAELRLALPGKAKRGGYLYALGYRDESVKVGYTTNPKSRVATHWSEAGKFGHRIMDVWLSPVHANYVENEKLAISACMDLGESRGGREYFVAPGLYAQLLTKLEGFEFHEGGTEHSDGRTLLAEEYVEEVHRRLDAEELLGRYKSAFDGLGLKMAEYFYFLILGSGEPEDRITKFAEMFPQTAFDRDVQDQMLDSLESVARFLKLSVSELLDCTQIEFVEQELIAHVRAEARLLRIIAERMGSETAHITLRDWLPDAAREAGL